MERGDAEQAMHLAGRMGRILAGHDPAVMGGALAETVAKWLAGHHPSVREGILKDWLEAMEALTEVNTKMLLEPHGGVWPKKGAMK